jgi:NADPH:quinone reductase-like Zn-dependent oxidoreductase
MKCVIFQNHGGVDVLEYGDRPDPKPGPDQVNVRLHSAALNHLDLWVREGWPGLKLPLPHIPGADGAGEIETLGEGVSGWQVGDRVVINANLGCGKCHFCLAGQDNRCVDWHLLGETIQGTYAEFVCVPARNLFKLPDDFDYTSAAAAGLVYHSAWHSLITRGHLHAGETVLIVGASGGVNTACIAIAKYSGAKVIVVGSSKEKLALAESLGADELIDRSRETDWSKSVYQVSGRKGVDLVVDNIGTTFPLSMKAARKGARILTVGNTGGAKFEIDNRYVFSKHLSIIGSTMGTIQDFHEVMSLVCSGKINVALDTTFPLFEARRAQERLQNGEQLGKITLTISP